MNEKCDSNETEFTQIISLQFHAFYPNDFKRLKTLLKILEQTRKPQVLNTQPSEK